MTGGSTHGRAVGHALVGAGLALLVAHLPLQGGGARWRRTNHRGRIVSLLSGPALGVGASLAGPLPQPAGAVAGLAAAVLGAYDDVAGSSAEQQGAKGLGGHLAALRSGRVTSGSVKVAGLSGSGLLAVVLLPGRRGPVDALLGGAVVAGSANLLNLLDLRPGRALKVGLLAALVLRQPGAAGAAGVLLPGDLGERQMLGDAGANALGAVLGLALVDRCGRRGVVAALTVLTSLTAASEVVSFSRVIDGVPPLRALDQLGRRS